MEMLWTQGPLSIREIQEKLPARKSSGTQPAYTTVQTIVYRLEWKKAVRRTKQKITNAHVFEAAISQPAVRRRMLDDLLEFWSGSALPVVAHLINSGRLSEEELREAQSIFRARTAKEKP